MEFINLKRIYEKNKKAIDRNVNDVLSSGRYIGGKYVDEIEDKLSQYIKTLCITCGNGTDALLIALETLGLRGKRVAIPAFGFRAAWEMVRVLAVNSDPVFVDIGDDFNINPELIPDDVDGVVAMSLFGVDCKYEAIRNKIGWNKRFIIDAAQSFTSDIGRQLVFADIVTTSFHPTKLLGCFGDGGALFTNNTYFRDVARCYRNHGRSIHGGCYVLEYGINSRLDNLQAAVLVARFENFEDELEMRKNIAFEYGTIKKHLEKSLYSCYSILSNNRETIRKSIEERGVPTKCYYNQPIFYNCNCPNSKRVAEKIFQVPIDPYMTKKEINIVKEAINDFTVR
jgi:UDP-2-acetamido-2-deoxy-ribo-hexuluronate aminotransferase